MNKYRVISGFYLYTLWAQLAPIEKQRESYVKGVNQNVSSILLPPIFQSIPLTKISPKKGSNPKKETKVQMWGNLSLKLGEPEPENRGGKLRPISILDLPEQKPLRVYSFCVCVYYIVFTRTSASSLHRRHSLNTSSLCTIVETRRRHCVCIDGQANVNP